MELNRRGFLSSLAGIVAWAKGPMIHRSLGGKLIDKERVSPTASAIQPTCDPDAMLKYLAIQAQLLTLSPRSSARIENTHAPHVNVGNLSKWGNAPVPDIYGERGGAFGGASVIDTIVS